MDFTYAEEKNCDVVLHGVHHFDLAQTLDCGQAFRWREVAPGVFSGIAHGRRLDVSLCDGVLRLKDVSLAEFERVWRDYFDFGRDYDEIFREFSQCENLRDALAFSPGLRLLRQDVWETLVSFILSQNSNIPRIKKMIESLCANFGEELPCGGYTFPQPAVLAALSPADLAPIKCGYRAAYVIDAARRVAAGEFSPHELENFDSEDISRALLSIKGVGPKVTDCVLLFGFSRTERFPADVWIKRVMSAFFPAGFPPEIAPHAGIAQQFLFRHAREKLPPDF